MFHRSFVAEMGIFVRELKRTVTGRETGSNKQIASKSCALSLVRQLYHLGVIEAYSGTLKQRKDDEQLAPYKVNINPELMSRVEKCILDLNLVVVDPQIRNEKDAIPFNLTVKLNFFLYKFVYYF